MKTTRRILLAAMLLAPGLALGADKIILKMGDNLPDRTNGWGAVVERINAEFKAANPGVEIITESYPDQPYQEKMKIYATAKQQPDVFKYWSFSTLLKPMVDGRFVVPLEQATFAKYGYLPGALESNVYDGKLYGIPVSADLWVVYYNKKLFKDAGIDKVPATLEEVIALAPRFKAKGIVPMTTDGKDAWPLAITLDQLVWRLAGDSTLPRKALERKMKFTDPMFVKAATLIQQMVKAGLFQEDLGVSDYGASRNLFGQGKAAMYLMGSWELGLATDSSFSEEFRANVDAFKFPTVAGGKGRTDDLFAWYGGNYVVSSSSKNVELGKKYLEFYASRFPMLAWEKQAAFPAQKVTAQPKDTALAKTLLRIASEATATSGTAALDLSTPAFKEDLQNAVRELSSNLLSPEEFCAKVDAAAEKAARKR
ncbi:MAG TPA: extracellular solute-binding protein [Burkholderiales bacterium]|nr:extracellular solute-binding protein [Burkholderiales bacterium]